MSYRSHVWSDVDPTRCGYFPRMLDGTFDYRAYVDWALQAPLLFLRRNGEYVTPSLTFGQLLAGGFGGEPARRSDWTDHLSTLFPEVRIKRVMEVRGADSVSLEMTGALPALWRGLLYDEGALDAALGLVPRLSYTEHLAFHEEAQRHGLRGKLRGASLSSMALEMVRLARVGLERIDPADAPLLEVLEARARSARSPAEDVLQVAKEETSPARLLARFALLPRVPVSGGASTKHHPCGEEHEPCQAHRERQEHEQAEHTAGPHEVPGDEGFAGRVIQHELDHQRRDADHSGQQQHHPSDEHRGFRVRSGGSRKRPPHT